MVHSTIVNDSDISLLLEVILTNFTDLSGYKRLYLGRVIDTWYKVIKHSEISLPDTFNISDRGRISAF